MAQKRGNSIQVKASDQEKAQYEATARRYRLPLATFARYAMEYVAKNLPELQISPDDNEEIDEEAHKQKVLAL